MCASDDKLSAVSHESVMVFNFTNSYNLLSTGPSVPSDQPLSIPVITRLIVSMYSIKIVYIERDSETKPGTLGTVLQFQIT